MTIQFTTFLAIDAKHLRELRVTWPTWIRDRPEIGASPLVIAHDDSIRESDCMFLAHSNVKFYRWDISEVTQRAKMLSSFVLLAPKVVETDWILKLDTDFISTHSDSRWCDDNLIANNPVFVASPWGYTKPANAIQILDNWGDSVPILAERPRLNNYPDANSDLVRTPGRIASWCFFGRTDWCKWAASLCDDKLPLPSHDTYLWYVAKRSGATYGRVKMRQFGWEPKRTRVK